MGFHVVSGEDNHTLDLHELRLIERIDLEGLQDLFDKHPEKINATSYRPGRCSTIGYAASLGHWEVVDLLIDYEADLEYRCHEDRFTPLMLACICSLQHEVNHNLCPKHLKFNHLEDAMEDSHSLSAKYLIEGGADPNAVDSHGRSALHLSALNGHSDIIELLLSQGVSIDAKDNFGWTPIFYAVQRGDKESVFALASAGADIDIEDGMGSSPLMHAAHYGHSMIIKELLNFGANCNKKDKQEMKPLDYAIMQNHKDAIKALEHLTIMDGNYKIEL